MVAGAKQEIPKLNVKKVSLSAPPGVNVCPACHAQNELGSLICKRCGEILSAKGKQGSAQEYDATEGGIKPGCWVSMAVAIVAAVLFFILAIKGGGAKPGTCEYNRGRIGVALVKYNMAHPEAKMKVLNLTELEKPGKNGKPFLKEHPICPIDRSAHYELDSDGISVICTACNKKRR